MINEQHMSDWWKIILGNVLPGFAIVAAVIIDRTEVHDSIDGLLKQAISQSKRMDEFDEKGTRLGQRESQTIERDQIRINKLEEFYIQSLPRLQRMEDRLDSINDWVEQQKRK